MATGSDVITGGDGARRISTILCGYFALKAAGSAYQEIARFLQFKRTGFAIDARLVEFDVLRRKAKSKMQMRAALPKAFVSALCMQHAALSRSGKSLVSASPQCLLGFPTVARQMGRLFGPCGGAAEQDVLAAADVDVSSDDDADFETRAA